jgi:hypothetical protein
MIISNTPDYTGAGVLPYYYNKTEDQVYYLLGKEGSGDWAEFGGAKDPKERPSATAIRELDEESLHTVNIGSQISNSLEKTAKVYNSKYGYALYVSDASNAKGIANVRTAFAAKRYPGKNLSHAQKEKIDMGWVKAADLTQSLINRRANFSSAVKQNEQVTVYASPAATSQVVDPKARLRPQLCGSLDRVVHIGCYPKSTVQNAADIPHLGSLYSGLKHFHGSTISSND